MSLLMKALQQAAQNRGDSPPGNAPDVSTPEADPARDAAATGDTPSTGARPAPTQGGELSLEPIEPVSDGASPGENLPADAASRNRSQTGAGHAPGRSPYVPGNRGQPGDSGRDSGRDSGEAAAATRAQSPAATAGAVRRSAQDAALPAADPGARVDILDRADGRDEPGWSSAALPAARPARHAGTNARQGAGSRSAARAAGSPERAGAILAAGAGAVKPGRLSQVTRLQWIILSGLGAGVVLFTYFYIQISHPGLLQRGLHSTQLLAQLTGVAQPGSTAATTAVNPISGTRGPAGGPIAGDGPREPSAVPAPIGPLPAGAEGSLAAAPSIPMTGVPPTPAPTATAPTVPGLPEALSSSPLLNPKPPADAAQPALPERSQARGPAAAAPAAATTTAPSATAAQPAVRQPVNAGTATRIAQPAGTGAASAPAAVNRETPPGSDAPASPGSRRDRTARPVTEAPGIQVTRGSAIDPLNPALGEAWEHLQAGRTDAARVLYQQVAAGDPRNIDALLGLAAIAQLGNQREAATGQYLRVLELDPRNAHAQASLIGLLGRADPVAAESQLKLLIGREPTPFLYFTLGNLYADQNRWPLAQQAFFQAHHLQPGNADYAFNLAVGLERIAQPKLALSYLRTAVGLADAGARANFDLVAARKRVSQLETAAEPR